jgi:3-oxoacyl-[acyl-carrier protein] reductase
MTDNQDKIAIVTGASRGIGRAVAIVLAEAGCSVVINYNKSRDEAEALLQELASKTLKAAIEQADVSDMSQAKRMAERVIAKYGRIDLLVNNAGLTKDGFLVLMSENDWNDVISANLTGVFNCCKVVSSHMLSQRKGCIINISSLSGITGLPGQANYAAAKGGVISFTKALAKELAPFGIRVNAIAPGVIETDMVGALAEKTKSNFLDLIPLKRFGKPEEVASVVRFLASEDASYITGETICVTGGLY